MNLAFLVASRTLSVLSSSSNSTSELSTEGGEVAVAWPRPALLMVKAEGCVEAALRWRLCGG
jgi:hypothetical protein